MDKNGGNWDLVEHRLNACQTYPIDYLGNHDWPIAHDYYYSNQNIPIAAAMTGGHASLTVVYI